ncbi:hypothetical protein Glove_115g27 [Diversispora epigaea]|uniref:Methyltransferase domain-containing protein n=1 Tax=Diversispora epigaea TaxID=1348612 RepID=A0A397JB19_9GLOM|nr:hypothetical protein Glove_115g27 [Diversispora epigaea]
MGNNKSALDKKSEKSFSQNEEYPCVNEESSYALPIDKFGVNYSAPILKYLQNGCKVLDIGCGAGIWMYELAIEFPSSIFVGVDLMPIYLSEIKQTNAEFVKSNILKGLPFKDNEFDYVHSKKMSTAFKEEEWINKVIPELIRVTKPQGWVEFYDVDVRLIDAGPNSTRLVEGIAQSMSNLGLNASSITFIKKWLQSYPDGITNINELTKLIPIGVWKSAIGKLNMMGYIDYVKLQKSWIADGMNISEDEFSKLVELTNAEFSSPEYKGKLPVMRVFGQKV